MEQRTYTLPTAVTWLTVLRVVSRISEDNPTDIWHKVLGGSEMWGGDFRERLRNTKVRLCNCVVVFVDRKSVV